MLRQSYQVKFLFRISSTITGECDLQFKLYNSLINIFFIYILRSDTNQQLLQRYIDLLHNRDSHKHHHDKYIKIMRKLVLRCGLPLCWELNRDLGGAESASLSVRSRIWKHLLGSINVDSSYYASLCTVRSLKLFIILID